MIYLAAFGPVLVFLLLLRWMDSYKLTPRNRILLALLAGAAAGLSYPINTAGFGVTPLWAKSGAPVVEEFLKAVYWIFLIQTARVAFLVDSSLCAFAIGAGFAVVENFTYLEGGLAVSVLRWFGTALMHGGVAAIGAMVSVSLRERSRWGYVPGLLAAMGVHLLFNQGWLSPLAGAIVMLVGMPVLVGTVFLWGEASLRDWVGAKLDQDIEVLDQLMTGENLPELPAAFPPEIRGDMLCLLLLTTELSVRAKGDLLLREAGIEIEADPELDAKFQEMAYLEKSIGPTGMRAILPLLSRTPRDLWELRRLAEK
ncbi:MAG: PrsW family intramembrane metalloprotease [Acidobacteria bacterium]|nr:PrsW family intramembrane metalloprotease [Acidobacteriota bacterium]